MFAHELDRARLRALVAHFLGERDPGSDFELWKRIVEDAIAVEIDFTPVGSLKDAVSIDSLEPGYGSKRRIIMGFRLTLHSPGMILQAPAGAVKGIVDCKGEV